MLPNAATSSKPIKPPRRLSLFNTSLGGGTTSLAKKLTGVINSDLESTTNLINNLNSRRNTSEMSSSNVCLRCKRFEVDLTNTSDNLSAIDAELKASRQVISLLQRQLELFQIEKEGLEKLIVSSQVEQTIHTSSDKDNKDQGQCYLPSTSDSSISDPQNSDMQKRLLNLIHTQLYTKDEEIVKLKSSLKETQNEKEQMNLQLHTLEDDVSKLKVEISILRENLALRDQTIVSLSNEVFEQSNPSEFNANQRRQSSADALDVQKNSLKTQRHITKLVDTLDAYKKTNELLSNNVMKLTDRCARLQESEIESRSQCQEFEAKCCQIQSKLLSLLKEIEQSSKQNVDGDATKQSEEVIRSDSVKLLIKRLLEDRSLDIPLSWKEGNRSKRHIGDNEKKQQECDELGFYLAVDQEENSLSVYSSPVNHSSSIRNRYSGRNLRRGLSEGGHLEPVEEGTEAIEHDFIETRSNSKNLQKFHSVDALKNDELTWRARWDNFIKDFDLVDLSKNKEFKNILRSGVPQEYRCKVWKALVGLKIGNERTKFRPDYYQSLLESNHPLSGSKKTLNPSSKQIELDLLRTLPNNRYFDKVGSPGTIRLRKVLTAYSGHNPQVGYCQGMNRLAAVALLVLPEEEAFWCLVAIVDKIMPAGYYNDLWLAQVDSNVVMEFVYLKMPALSNHFKENDIELSLFSWFLTIFVDGTPPSLFLRLWDCFLYEGDKVMFRVALAMLKMYEKQLLKLNNSVVVNNFLRSAVNAAMDIDRFFEVAFDVINPLSSRSLRVRREQSFQAIKGGLRSLASQSAVSGSTAGGKVAGKDCEEDIGSPNEDSSIISI